MLARALGRGVWLAMGSLTSVAVVSVVLAPSAAAGSSGAGHGEGAVAPIKGVDSMWVWRARPAAELAAVAASSGGRRVFLFVGDASHSGDAVIRDSVSALHSLDIEVYALAGEPAWTVRHATAMGWARRAQSLAPFDGIHLDVEPHRLRRWRSDQARLVADYLLLLDGLRQLPGRLEVDAQFAAGSITTPGGTFADDSLARVDGVTVMSYRDTAVGTNSMIGVATDWLQRATQAGVQIWLAAETNPLPDCPYCTFYEEGQARMAAVFDEVDEMARRLCPTYRGISVEDLDGWLALGP